MASNTALSSGYTTNTSSQGFSPRMSVVQEDAEDGIKEDEAETAQTRLTFFAFLLALSSGTLYAWACLSEEVEAHFGWSHSAATDIFSLGFVGEFVPAFTFGLVLKHYGPQIGTAFSTSLVTVSYFGIWIQTLVVCKIWLIFALLHAVMGYGSIGFYFCSLYIAGSLWPPEMSGKVLGGMAATYAGSGALTAQIYKLSGSLEVYYGTLTVLCLIVGLSTLWALRKYPLPTSRSAPSSRASSPRGPSAGDTPKVISISYGSTGSSVSGASSDANRDRLASSPMSAPGPTLGTLTAPKLPPARASTVDDTESILAKARVRGASEPSINMGHWVSKGGAVNYRLAFAKRPTFAADLIIHQSSKQDVMAVMYGPVDDEDPPIEVVNWNKILSAPEFWTLLATFLCLNGTSLMIVAQLDTLKHMMGITGVHTETLVILYQVSDCCARLGLAVISDATSHTVYFRRNFYVIVANGFMVLALNLLLWGSSNPSLPLLVAICMCGGMGNGSSSMIGPVIVRQTFGTQWIGIVLGLMKAGQALSNVVFGKFFVYSTANTTYPTTKYIASVKVSMCLVCCSLSMATYIWYKSIVFAKSESKSSSPNNSPRRP